MRLQHVRDFSSSSDESNFDICREQQKNAFEIGDEIFANTSDRENEKEVKMKSKKKFRSSSLPEEALAY